MTETSWKGNLTPDELVEEPGARKTYTEAPKQIRNLREIRESCR